MMTKPLVSIIIPTFNRAHLIGETLDSILVQTYKKWECIIVDDGSNDNTDEVVGAYLNKDGRFKYYHRPEEHLPGGNGARNYGFKMSQGKYIQWFDSDDIMVYNKLELKVYAFLSGNVDFVVSKWRYFNAPENVQSYTRVFKANEVNFESFTTLNVSWVTNDFMVKREIADRLSFNEYLKNGQEFNYIAKMLLLTNNLSIINDVLVNRRHADDSIGVTRRKDKFVFLSSTFNSMWITFKEVYPLSNYNRKFGSKILLRCIRIMLEIKDIEKPITFNREVIRFFGVNSLNYFLALISSRTLGNYWFFYNKLKRKS